MTISPTLFLERIAEYAIVAAALEHFLNCSSSSSFGSSANLESRMTMSSPASSAAYWLCEEFGIWLKPSSLFSSTCLLQRSLLQNRILRLLPAFLTCFRLADFSET